MRHRRYVIPSDPTAERDHEREREQQFSKSSAETVVVVSSFHAEKLTESVGGRTAAKVDPTRARTHRDAKMFRHGTFLAPPGFALGRG